MIISSCSYNFDRAGNVSAISNPRADGMTAYTYDALNRLRTATTTGFTNTARRLDRDYEWHKNGNIKSKSDIGVYTSRAATSIVL